MSNLGKSTEDEPPRFARDVCNRQWVYRMTHAGGPCLMRTETRTKSRTGASGERVEGDEYLWVRVCI